MESPNETARLVAQAEADTTEQRLLETGLAPGSRALDVGCGPGVITQIMAKVVGPAGAAVGIDQSPERIREAQQRAGGVAQLRFEVGDARRLPYGDASFDYCWSQFVLEYLADRGAVLRELKRVVRPGGRVVISEIDGTGFGCWPMSAEIEAGLREVERALASTGFDLQVGRKLYAEFLAAGLVNVRVRLYPQYVIAGSADARLMEDWRTRFAALEPLAVPRFGGREAYLAFTESYLRLLADPGALKFAILLVTEGQVP